MNWERKGERSGAAVGDRRNTMRMERLGTPFKRKSGSWAELLEKNEQVYRREMEGGREGGGGG